MRTPVTLLAMLVGLVALFGVAINLGESIVAGSAPMPNRQRRPRSGGDSDYGTGPGGLAVAGQGYVLRPRTTRFTAGETTNFRFTVFTADGKPVTDFARNQDQRMNLIIVRRDISGYQHLFPIMAPDCTWSVSLRLDRPGTYRAFAEFLPGVRYGTGNSRRGSRRTESGRARTHTECRTFGNPARGRPGLRTCTCVLSQVPAGTPQSASKSRRRAPGTTGCSWNFSTMARCGPQSSPCWRGDMATVRDRGPGTVTGPGDPTHQVDWPSAG
jgi:hypothetical protein